MFLLLCREELREESLVLDGCLYFLRWRRATRLMCLEVRFLPWRR